MSGLARWNAWLLAPAPGSRMQAQLGRSYLGLRRFFANPTTALGVALVLVVIALAILAPLIAPQDPLAQNLPARLEPPSAAHWLGTDELGRDLWSRIAYGARPTLLIVALVAIIVGPLGLAVGIIAGFVGGLLDRVLMRLTDMFMAFPQLVLALALAAALGAGLTNAVIAIAMTSWPPYARLARSETLVLRHTDFIAAIRIQGASRARILLRHVLPLCLPSMLIRLSLDMAGIILIAASLGFLGLGTQPPRPEWGAMVASGRDMIIDQWWVSTLPGFAILITSLGLNLIGDGLRDLLDPRRMQMTPLVTVEDLHVTFRTPRGAVEAVRGISWTMGREKLGVVGESGSGKSVSARALLGLVRPPGEVRAARLALDGTDLRNLSPRQWADIRGSRATMVMQDPRFSLNPVMPVGQQIAEALRAHRRVSRQEARQRTLDILHAVHIRDPARVFTAYPHEVSGGMGQRVMIAMMLIAEPELLIADEPTSALDRSVGEQVLAVMDELAQRRGMGLILISHDLDLVARFCDRVLIMYRGRIVETLAAAELANARHPYTQALLACRPRLGVRRAALPVIDRAAVDALTPA
jgi:peptide/nickel transport system permease protein